MEKNSSPVFDPATIDFVTVAAQVCASFEQAASQPKSQFVDTTLKLLALLYVKASLLPACERIDEREVERFVTEADYEQIRMGVAAVMGNQDDYLEVFLEDMAFSETPIRQTISESLADLYQPLKDFLGVFELGFEPTMYEALAECEWQFAEFWGQRLVNVMRALHQVKFDRSAADEGADGRNPFDETVTEDELYEGLPLGDDETDEEDSPYAYR